MPLNAMTHSARTGAPVSIPHFMPAHLNRWVKTVLQKDRKKFFEVARGSALECASCLDILVAKRRISTDRVIEGKEKLRSIVNLLTKI